MLGEVGALQRRAGVTRYSLIPISHVLDRVHASPDGPSSLLEVHLPSLPVPMHCPCVPPSSCFLRSARRHPAHLQPRVDSQVHVFSIECWGSKELQVTSCHDIFQCSNPQGQWPWIPSCPIKDNYRVVPSSPQECHQVFSAR